MGRRSEVEQAHATHQKGGIFMKATLQTLAALSFASTLMIGCHGKDAESPEGAAEEAGEEIDEAAEDTEEAIDEAADDVEDSVD